jgi:hypothetical protein
MIADNPDREILAELERLLAQLKSRHTVIADSLHGDPRPIIEALERDVDRLRAVVEELDAHRT